MNSAKAKITPTDESTVINEGGEENKEEKKEEDELKRKQSDFVYDNHKGRMEIISILAHELGHWANMDTIKLTSMNLLRIYVLFFAFGYSFSNTDMPSTFGFNK